MQIEFVNQCAADASFGVEFGGQSSGRTAVLHVGQSATMDISNIGITDGQSCWARAYVQAGPNHDSRDNFAFHTGSSQVVVYTLTGTVDTPSFSCTGCS